MKPQPKSAVVEILTLLLESQKEFGKTQDIIHIKHEKIYKSNA